MSVINLITNEEADVFNALSEDWLALDEAQKTNYIFNASLYMQTRWTCIDVDWTDTTTLTDVLKRACAYYAEADRLQVLFAEMTPTDAKGRVIEETGKVGTLLETTKWADSGAIYSGDPLEKVDALMYISCTRSGVGSSELVRV